MKQRFDRVLQQWMEANFPKVAYRATVTADEHHATVVEVFNDAVVSGRSRAWKWKRTGLRGWVKWEGPDA